VGKKGYLEMMADGMVGMKAVVVRTDSFHQGKSSSAACLKLTNLAVGSLFVIDRLLELLM